MRSMSCQFDMTATYQPTVQLTCTLIYVTLSLTRQACEPLFIYITFFYTLWQPCQLDHPEAALSINWLAKVTQQQ